MRRVSTVGRTGNGRSPWLSFTARRIAAQAREHGKRTTYTCEGHVRVGTDEASVQTRSTWLCWGSTALGTA